MDKRKQSNTDNMVTEEQSIESLRIKELEEQIVTYCRENPAAEEWFQITVNRDTDGRE
jgi:hypothetical protein